MPAGLPPLDLLSRHKSLEEERLATARAAWLALDEPSQRLLVAEVVETRAEELRRAYPALLRVGQGFRVVGNRVSIAGRVQRGRRENESCVVFTVPKKWTKAQRTAAQKIRTPKKGGKRSLQRGERLPHCLLAYWPVPGSSGTPVRTLCAVPTDVRDAREFHGVAHAGDVVMEGLQSGKALKPQTGMITVIVRVPNETDRFVLSCHHVMAMSLATSGGLPADSAIAFVQSNRDAVAVLEPGWAGWLTTLPDAYSFDAALGRLDAVTGDQALGRVCFVAPVAFVPAPNEVPLDCTLVLENGRRVACEYQQEHPDFDSITYFAGASRQPRHPRILEFHTRGERLFRGQSGAVIVSTDEKVMVGMHIGGPQGGTISYAIPAYELFKKENWQRAASPALW